jgi:hypothetical protein
MMNKDVGKPRGRITNLSLSDKQETEVTQVPSEPEPATNKVVEGGDKSIDMTVMENAIMNIDETNINTKRTGNGKIETRQMTVLLSVENIAKMKSYQEKYGARATWQINTALTRFFEQCNF